MTDPIFKTFKALVPNPIGDTQFPAGSGWCSVAEPDLTRVMPDGTTGEQLWVLDTTYAVNARVVYNHRVYLSASDGVSQITPPNDPTRWTDEGPSNRWAWADSESSTRTVTTSPLEITIRPGAFTHIGLAGMKDIASVRVEQWSSDGGELVHDHTYTTNDTSSTTPLWDLYFRAPTYAAMKILSGFPVYPRNVVRLTFTSYTGSIEIGLVDLSRPTTLGACEVSATATYRDYGYTTTNKWGNTVRTAGAKGKDLKCSAVFMMEEANNVDRALRALLDTGAIYVPSEQTKFAWLMTWGLIKPAEITPDANNVARATFDIEGLI